MSSRTFKNNSLYRSQFAHSYQNISYQYVLVHCFGLEEDKKLNESYDQAQKTMAVMSAYKSIFNNNNLITSQETNGKRINCQNF